MGLSVVTQPQEFFSYRIPREGMRTYEDSDGKNGVGINMTASNAHLEHLSLLLMKLPDTVHPPACSASKLYELGFASHG